jgi:hypothetical protein
MTAEGRFLTFLAPRDMQRSWLVLRGGLSIGQVRADVCGLGYVFLLSYCVCAATVHCLSTLRSIRQPSQAHA